MILTIMINTIIKDPNAKDPIWYLKAEYKAFLYYKF